MFLDPRYLGAAAFLGVLILAGMVLPGQLSALTVSSTTGYGFSTATDAQIKAGNGMTLYGDRLFLENLDRAVVHEGSSTLQNPDQPYAVLHYGDQTRHITADQDTYSIDAATVTIMEKTSRYKYRCGTGICTQSADSIHHILYRVNLEIPSDQITATVENLTVEDVGQGRKKITASITVTTGGTRSRSTSSKPKSSGRRSTSTPASSRKAVPRTS